MLYSGPLSSVGGGEDENGDHCDDESRCDSSYYGHSHSLSHSHSHGHGHSHGYQHYFTDVNSENRRFSRSSRLSRRSRASRSSRGLNNSRNSQTTCLYEFEHDCELANCDDPVFEWLESGPERFYKHRVTLLHIIGFVAIYSSIGTWVGIWNNASITGMVLPFCAEFVEGTDEDVCETPSAWYILGLWLFGMSLQYLAASLLQNGQILAPNDPIFSRVERFWEARIDPLFLAMRGMIAYVGQIFCTCGMYTFVLTYFSSVDPHPLKDLCIALTGLVLFSGIIVFYEYYSVGLSIERMEGGIEPSEVVIEGVPVPVPEQVVHFSSVLDSAAPIVLEPWEEIPTQAEIAEEIHEMNPTASRTNNLQRRVEAVMNELIKRRQLRNLRFAVLSLFSLFLQSCAWLGVDRLGQVWLFPERAGNLAMDAHGHPLTIQYYLFGWKSGIWGLEVPTAGSEVSLMAIGMLMMISTNTFLIHACVDPTRNVAAEYELELNCCGGLFQRKLDRTSGVGLFHSWFVEFIGLCGNFINLTGAWYLIDEHSGFPENTYRNLLLILFVIPLVLTGSFFNDAGVDAGEQGAIRYVGLGIRRVSQAVSIAISTIQGDDDDESEEERALETIGEEAPLIPSS